MTNKTIIVKASEFLGTPAAEAEIVERRAADTRWPEPYLMVRIVTEPDWVGPVTADGTVLIDHPDGLIMAP